MKKHSYALVLMIIFLAACDMQECDCQIDEQPQDSVIVELSDSAKMGNLLLGKYDIVAFYPIGFDSVNVIDFIFDFDTANGQFILTFDQINVLYDLNLNNDDIFISPTTYNLNADESELEVIGNSDRNIDIRELNEEELRLRYYSAYPKVTDRPVTILIYLEKQ